MASTQRRCGNSRNAGVLGTVLVLSGRPGGREFGGGRVAAADVTPDVRLRASSVAHASIAADHRAGRGRRGRHELERAGDAVVWEQPLAATEQEGLDQDDELVNEIVLDELLGE
jgi:hypothetical protein